MNGMCIYIPYRCKFIQPEAQQHNGMTNSEPRRESHQTKSEVNWQCFMQRLSDYYRDGHAEADKNLLKG